MFGSVCRARRGHCVPAHGQDSIPGRRMPGIPAGWRGRRGGPASLGLRDRLLGSAASEKHQEPEKRAVLSEIASRCTKGALMWGEGEFSRSPAFAGPFSCAPEALQAGWKPPANPRFMQ